MCASLSKHHDSLFDQRKESFIDDLTYRFSFMYVLLSPNTVTEIMLTFGFYKYIFSPVLTSVAYRDNWWGLASKTFHTSD